MTSEADRDALEAVHAREAAFHDALARETEIAPPREPDVYECALLEATLPLEGLHVLELGCGDGEITLRLVEQGARVSAVDISPATVELARKRLARFRPDADVELHVAPAENTPFADASFDFVVGKWILHHIDLPRGVEEVARLLRPGGHAVFIETSAFNPVLSLARRHVVQRDRFRTHKSGTADEHPLTRQDVRMIARRFSRCEVDYPVFFLFHMLDVNVLKHRSRAWSYRLARWDRAIGRVRLLRPLSYYLRLRLQK